ncbi:FAD-dependent oxidoreductase [uncultured Aeromicrobium sp.]|uniref:oxidoreductase n=1 Tax=uncultured Aeromicrobium sp. TaxID=337820 RepID=UPI0025D3FF42|nr:FAD-dependent oxidoreductase [uncultured Aeromicrobium sp.]
MRQSDPLFDEITIGGLRLRNRIVSTSHEPAYSENGLPTRRYLSYHVEKARGGVGLTMVGGSAIVSRDSTPSFGNLQVWKDEIVPPLHALSDAVHAEGAAVMIQLTHLGHRTSNYSGDWVPALSASAVREPAHRAFTRAAREADLNRVADDFVSAAERCRSAGLDGIELMAYGHLLDSFWSPLWNYRDDEYGGSLENRLRFPLRVIRAVRQAAGTTMLLGIRMTFDEERPDGLSRGEALQIADRIVGEGIDFVSVIKGTIGRDAELAKVIPTMGSPGAPHLEFTGEIRRALNVPVMHAARIADVATARYAVAEGLVDLVGMTRALIADPHLPRKVRAGREDDIRPCVGASMCIDGIYASGAAYCIHNASTGRETDLPHVPQLAALSRRVGVVGAGPAGLEAARVAAERGHQVTVFEAANRAGGQLLLAASSVRRRDLIGIVDWRLAELRRLGVELQLNHYAGPDDLLGAFDTVIVASGGMPRLAAPSVENRHLLTDTWDVLTGRRVGERVVVYDDHGGHPALDAAERLLRSGVQVEFVTPERTVAPEIGSLVSAAYLSTLADLGMTITPLHRLESVVAVDSGLAARFRVDGAQTATTRVIDAVVAEHGTEPNLEVFEALVEHSVNRGDVSMSHLVDGLPQPYPEGFTVYRIGDALASRNIHAAILDAARVCMAL